jgi:hypothetical protein
LQLRTNHIIPGLSHCLQLRYGQQESRGTLTILGDHTQLGPLEQIRELVFIIDGSEVGQECTTLMISSASRWRRLAVCRLAPGRKMPCKAFIIW